MNKKHLLLSILLMAGILLSGCATPSSAAEDTAVTAQATQIQLVDGLERTVTLEEPAQRIVSMAPSITEILFAIGAGNQVVGRDSFSDYPEEAKTVQDIGGSMGDYSYETIASLNPDIVLATEINTPEQVKALEDLKVTVYYISNPTDLDGLCPTIQQVGQLAGRSEEAEALCTSLQERVDAVVDTISHTETHPTVFYELDGSDPAKPWTSGPGTFLDQLVSMAGGKNLGSVMTDAWGQISVEEILIQDPDIIILGDSNYGMTPEAVAERTGWESLSAVKDNQIFVFDDNIVSRPSPRLVDGLEQLAKLIHPELYK